MLPPRLLNHVYLMWSIATWLIQSLYVAQQGGGHAEGLGGISVVCECM
jgi:hypothetical protein